MKNIKNFVRIAALAFLALPFFANTNSASAMESWGPQDRPTYTWEVPANHRTMNSITNNPNIGDERNFLRVRKAGTTDNFEDSVLLEPGQEYEFFVYFHNNAASNLNDSGKGIADDVRVSMSVPERLTAGQAGIAKATITSSNTDPRSVWDAAVLNTDSTVYLRYVPNSAVIHSLGSIDGSIINGEALFSEAGAYVGYYSTLWGVLPGCNEYAGYITFNLKADFPAFTVDKKASIAGANNYLDKITVAPGDEIDFKILYKNTGSTDQNRIAAYDVLPDGMEYISSTTYIRTSENPNGTFTEDKLFNGGLMIGDYHPGQYAEISYKVRIKNDAALFGCGDTVIHNNSSVATSTGTEYDQVDVTVHRECLETPSELPNTGAGEIVIGLIAVTGIGVTAAYFIATEREYKKLQKQADGKK